MSSPQGFHHPFPFPIQAGLRIEVIGGPPPATDEATRARRRFWNKVQKTPTCWLWTAGGGNGYGEFYAFGRKIRAHRFAYEVAYGPVPDGLDVLHRCDNRRCVRPDHLFPGTNLDNIRDKVSKGRHLRGERSAHAKLTDAKVVAIRSKYAAGGHTYSSLAREYGVAKSTIGQVLLNIKWRHVERD